MLLPTPSFARQFRLLSLLLDLTGKGSSRLGDKG